MAAGKANTRGRIVERARHNGGEASSAACVRFQDHEQNSPSPRSAVEWSLPRSASVPAIFFVRQTKKAGAWPASTDCSSAVSRLTLIRRAVPRFEAHWAFESYVRRRRFELRPACACRAQLAVRAADSMPGLVAIVLDSLRTPLYCKDGRADPRLTAASKVRLGKRGYVQRTVVTAGRNG